MTRRFLMTIVPLVLLGCAANGSRPAAAAPRARSWDGMVRVHGALRAILHQGRTEARVTLDKVLPDPNLYAVGALAGLSGEITVVAGNAYLSYPDGDATRTEASPRAAAGATLLVAADVPAWKSVTTERPIPFDEIDEEIARLAAAAGMSLDRRFPFLMEGEFEDLRWHVIDGRRLKAGATSHEDHLPAAVKTKLDRATATLIGFYSQSDQGVFTHMGSRTHIHCALAGPLAAGHVDHVLIPAGTTVKFPAVGAAPAPRARPSGRKRT